MEGAGDALHTGSTLLSFYRREGRESTRPKQHAGGQDKEVKGLFLLECFLKRFLGDSALVVCTQVPTEEVTALVSTHIIL